MNDDDSANLADLAVLASRWLDTVCDDCDDADLTGDGNVNGDDLEELADNWLL
jgi:hypothetical protein